MVASGQGGDSLLGEKVDAKGKEGPRVSHSLWAVSVPKASPKLRLPKRVRLRSLGSGEVTAWSPQRRPEKGPPSST